jgi:uncharacterized membrane protein YdcZ (DUF606 family)
MVRGTVIAVIAGAVIALQVRLLGQVSADAGPAVVGFLVSAASLAAALVVVVAVRDWGSVGRIGPRSDWVVAGALGVVAIAGLGAASARVGTVATVAGSIVGQLLVGAVLDRVS